jgi:hypothetical protein
MELQILKFLTVEQVAMASDAQLQRVGMGAAGLRDRARAWIAKRNISANRSEMDDLKAQLEEMKALLAEKRGPGRPKKVTDDDNASTGEPGYQ